MSGAVHYIQCVNIIRQIRQGEEEVEAREKRNFLTTAELLIMIDLWVMRQSEIKNPDVSRINMEKRNAPPLPPAPREASFRETSGVRRS